MCLLLSLRFIIELCEPIQVKQLDIANFELFSSTPKDFLVSISDRYVVQPLNVRQYGSISVMWSVELDIKQSSNCWQLVNVNYKH